MAHEEHLDVNRARVAHKAAAAEPRLQLDADPAATCAATVAPAGQGPAAAARPAAAASVPVVPSRACVRP